MDATKLTAALKALDPANDEHWTRDGAPALAILSELAGEKVLRSDISVVAPQFMRNARVFPGDSAAPGGTKNDGTVDNRPEGAGDHENVDDEDGGLTLEQMQAEHDDLEQEIARFNAGFEKAKAHLHNLHQRRAELGERLEMHKPKVSFEQSVQGYFAHLRTVREALIASDPNAGKPRYNARSSNQSALDSAFRANRDPAARRPMVPLQ